MGNPLVRFREGLGGNWISGSCLAYSTCKPTSLEIDVTLAASDGFCCTARPFGVFLSKVK
jgi:hypothetical protein